MVELWGKARKTTRVDIVRIQDSLARKATGAQSLEPNDMLVCVCVEERSVRLRAELRLGKPRYETCHV